MPTPTSLLKSSKQIDIILDEISMEYPDNVTVEKLRKLEVRVTI